MEVADTAFLAIELSLVLLFVIGLATSTQAHAQAASLLLGGSYTAPFWVLVVLLGIVVPMVIQFLVVIRRVGHAPIAPLLVLMGGLALRVVIVSAGQASEWTTLAGRM
jgi:formate-dependent nitrite reductase membrane component NrfD